MAFSSIEFLCAFFPVTLILYFLLGLLEKKLPHRRVLTARNVLLLAASLLFYAYGEPVYILLLLVSVCVNYAAALLLGRSDVSRKKALLAAVVVFDIGMLCVYKYSGLFVSLINSALRLSIPVPQLSLPIGISFYTFQELSYVIDVYRGDTKAQRSLYKVMLYISFFPQLIAGPIIKYHDIEAQINERSTSLADCADGMKRFILGLSKKVLIANNMAVVADSVFGASGDSVGFLAAWTGALAYMMQIYFDFSGYSDMAIGLGGMFGFTIGENFRYPYVADSIKEFWRRWHISLSSWFREYLYIPLGGNRKGRARTALNKMIVFALTGFWHGANWTFLVWGLYHGLLLNLEDQINSGKRQRSERPGGLRRFGRHFYTLLAVCVGFVIFRADSLGQAAAYIGRMFGIGCGNADNLLANRQFTPLFIAAFVCAVVFSLPLYELFPRLRSFRNEHEKPCEYLGYALSALLLFVSTAALSGNGYNPFIYFRF